MRVVLDSNVVISGYIFGGPPAELIHLALDGKFDCFTTIPILDEIRDVLSRPKFKLTPEQALSFIEEYHALCLVVRPVRNVTIMKENPDDNKILECALAAQADLIVTGDSHLLDLSKWKRIRIMTPSQALLEF